MNIVLLLSLLTSVLFGLSLGSFLNVLIYRLPRKESIVFPGSHCPVCGTSIKYRDNIPIVGFILLRGRCRECSTPISLRYPLVEFMMACIVVVLFIQNGFSVNFFAETTLGAILLTSACIDLQYMIIPDRLTYPGFFIAFLFSFRWGWNGFCRGIQGIIVVFLILAFMFLTGKLLFRRDSLGMGDFKLGCVLGFFVGPLWSFIAIVIAIVVGGIWGLFQLVTGKKMMGQEVPFGPFLAGGGFCVMFFKQHLLFLVEQYLSMFK
ncbi:MAG TPA: prepilin peptidase [Anaerolineae bacterium]|nr:prepilin peptidase [Anaerolineae bacterium]